MNRIYTASPYHAPAIRAAALAVVLFAGFGSQPVAARLVALTYAEAAVWVRTEAVGWAEWSESHHDEARALPWWDSLRSAHPARYTWGRDLSAGLQGAGGIGRLMAVRDHAAGRTLWPAYDDRGNVTALVDAAEHTVLAAIEYGPYGQLLAVDAAPGAGIDRTNLAALCPLLFSTKYLDAELLPSGGLYYYGRRMLHIEQRLPLQENCIDPTSERLSVTRLTRGLHERQTADRLTQIRCNQVIASNDQGRRNLWDP